MALKNEIKYPEDKKKKIICDFCNTEITDEQQRVHIVEEVIKPKSKIYINKYFHSPCWIKKFNKTIEYRLRQSLDFGKAQINKILTAI